MLFKHFYIFFCKCYVCLISQCFYYGSNLCFSFFSKLFSGSPAAIPPLKYRITVKSQGEATVVSVLNTQGAAESSANAQRIVQVIADDLK